MSSTDFIISIESLINSVRRAGSIYGNFFAASTWRWSASCRWSSDSGSPRDCSAFQRNRYRKLAGNRLRSDERTCSCSLRRRESTPGNYICADPWNLLQQVWISEGYDDWTLAPGNKPLHELCKRLWCARRNRIPVLSNVRAYNRHIS